MARNGDTRPATGNVANIITVVRILLAPVFIWMLLADGGAGRAAALGRPRCSSSRSRPTASTATSPAGTTSSPTSASSSTRSPTRCSPGERSSRLSILGELPWWVTIVILVREIGITVVPVRRACDQGGRRLAWGKLKTVVQAVAISLALLPLWTVVGDWMLLGQRGGHGHRPLVLTVYTGHRLPRRLKALPVSRA